MFLAYPESPALNAKSPATNPSPGFIRRRENEMNSTNAKICLKNPRAPELDAVEIDALADTGAVHLCIPEGRETRSECDYVSRLSGISRLKRKIPGDESVAGVYSPKGK